MQYILVQNKQTLLLGPMDWRPRFFQSEINDLIDNGDLTTDWKSPPIEPGYVDLGNGFEIFPVVESIKPSIDDDFEQHAGPFFTYDKDGAHESYTTIPHSIDTVKSNLKNLAAKVRHHKENNLNTKVTVKTNGKIVTIDTSRENRHQLLHKHLALQDKDQLINFKAPEGWVKLNKNDFNNILFAIDRHIQTHFDWEYDTHAKIDSTSTIDELKIIKSAELNLFPHNQPGV